MTVADVIRALCAFTATKNAVPYRGRIVIGGSVRECRRIYGVT